MSCQGFFIGFKNFPFTAEIRSVSFSSRVFPSHRFRRFPAFFDLPLISTDFCAIARRVCGGSERRAALRFARINLRGGFAEGARAGAQIRAPALVLSSSLTFSPLDDVCFSFFLSALARRGIRETATAAIRAVRTLAPERRTARCESFKIATAAAEARRNLQIFTAYALPRYCSEEDGSCEGASGAAFV